MPSTPESSSNDGSNGFIRQLSRGSITEERASTDDELDSVSSVSSPGPQRNSPLPEVLVGDFSRRPSSAKKLFSSPRLRRITGTSVPTEEDDDEIEIGFVEPVVLRRGTIAPQRPDDPLFDPWCDPENPIQVTFEDVSAAAYMLKGGIQLTPCTLSHMSAMTGVNIYFKKDLFQFTGSFKERGARNFLLRLKPKQRAAGVIACSAGNHALALSYHGKQLGVPVTVVMPKSAPLMKVTLCKQYGSTVIIHGDNIAEAKEYAMRMGCEKNYTYVNGFDHPWILAGQGTCGLEMLEQVPDMDAVVIPVGGGGYLAGIAVAIKTMRPNVLVIGVESERSPGFWTAMESGKPVFTPTSSSLADGLSVPVVGFNSFATAAPLVDKMIVVKEEFIALSILRLVEMEKVVCEGAGAVGLAAILSGQLPELVGKKVVIPLSGGNIDTTVLGRCLERGLAADGRLCRFRVVISDRPGGMAELTKLICQLDVSLKDIFHERAWLRYDVFSVAVTCVVETRDWSNAKALEEALRQKYTDVVFSDGFPT
ncbi:L-threonine ammonia-lyase-like [Paramacrobiotus metropolitanus]|uniref:L-threonine ammonia-lyase-like n=1 Tax=Paramacrobiotus metropolitanus TaxID=2943436 RepID=UPI0024457D43|nr:L-threonine ammonia-lyase-like [Paramacrobiotus metropolitanus]